jgi:predicted transcriptional regulator
LKHRPRVVIYVEILAELRERPSGRTRLSRAANLSYDKCVEILRELEAKGLVRKDSEEGHDVYRTTPEGYQVVEDWNKLWGKLRP